MSITSISRIQHRRGLKTDLPDQLFEGEFGWCLDSRELFIGNGDGFSGNTQLLTQYTDNTQIINYTYRGPTTIAPTTGQNGMPSVRTLGQRLDDWLSIKDYGVAGDGITDDTVNIQQAISDRWATLQSSANPMSFAAIYFPPGVYRITKAINVYPNIILLADDHINTIIKMDVSTDLCVFRTVDNLGQNGYNIGLNGAALPSKVLIQGLTLDNSNNSNADGIWIQRTSAVRIVNCNIIGRWASGISTTLNTNGIKIETLGSLNVTNNIQIVNTIVSNFVNAVRSDDPAKYIFLDKVHIHDSWRGISSGVAPVAGGPSFIKVTNSLFHNIDDNGIISDGSNPGVTSINNIFDTVGDKDNVAVISYGANAIVNSSINDSFSRMDSSRISIVNPIVNTIISPQQYGFTSSTPTTLQVPLLDNQTNAPTGITYNPAQYNTIMIEFSIRRGISLYMSRVYVVGDGTNVAIGQTANADLNSTGIVLSASIIDGLISVNYTSTSTGNNATMNYTETKWLT